jgi:ribose transport system ATP-binding protein
METTMTTGSVSTNALEMRDMQKSFASIPVLKNVSFDLRKGEVHALMGGNGAGKSTLMKILSGAYLRDGGELTINGKHYTFSTPRDSEAAGIAMIYQELSLVPTLTVAQNIFLNREPRKVNLLNDAEAVRRARDILAELGEDIDPRARGGPERRCLPDGRDRQGAVEERADPGHGRTDVLALRA